MPARAMPEMSVAGDRLESEDGFGKQAHLHEGGIDNLWIAIRGRHVLDVRELRRGRLVALSCCGDSRGSMAVGITDVVRV